MATCRLCLEVNVATTRSQAAKKERRQLIAKVPKEVLEDNYGGEPLNGLTSPAQRQQVRSMKRFTNAYMLVYIRDDAIDEILAPFTEADTPTHLSASS